MNSITNGALPQNLKAASVDELAKTVQELSLARDLDSVMKIVRTVARKLTGADGATFVLRDGDMCYYADEDAVAPLWKGNRFPMKICISGWVMNNKMEAVIPDIYQDERIPVDAYRPTFVKSLAMVPIRTINPLGAIGNYWATHHQPTAEELTLLKALANITAVSIENINIRNQLEEKVIERTKELNDSLLREKELNTQKSAFVSFASHEFKTPLSAIKSSVSLVENYLNRQDTENQKRHLSRIKSSVNNLISILNDFLSLEKIESANVQSDKSKFDVNLFLAEIAEELAELKKPGQEIVVKHQGPVLVMQDKNILRNILLNLASNAVKYSEQEVLISSSADNGILKIRIIDKGIGIPAEEIENVFGKFFRASNAVNVNGTGLGLMIVKRYVDLLSGNISFTSEENVGTTFEITLPCGENEKQFTG